MTPQLSPSPCPAASRSAGLHFVWSRGARSTPGSFDAALTTRSSSACFSAAARPSHRFTAWWRAFVRVHGYDRRDELFRPLRRGRRAREARACRDGCPTSPRMCGVRGQLGGGHGRVPAHDAGADRRSGPVAGAHHADLQAVWLHWPRLLIFFTLASSGSCSPAKRACADALRHVQLARAQARAAFRVAAAGDAGAGRASNSCSTPSPTSCTNRMPTRPSACSTI